MVRLTRRLRNTLPRLPRPAARWGRLFALGIIVGLLGGLAAAGLHLGIEHGSRLLVGRLANLSGVDTFRFEWPLLLLPALGGLFSGVVAFWLCPEAVGHGTDVLTRAFHREMGAMPLKAPLIKGVATVAVISSGGSAGPEGPAAALGAGLGSFIGRIFKLRPRERRFLLVAGCGAGVGAIFQSPLGGALFATSVLYSEEEFEYGAMVPAFVASVIGYTTLKTVIGGLGSFDYMLHSAHPLVFSQARELLPYALLGPLCALAAIIFGVSLRFVERRLVPRSHLPRWFVPGLGGLATGTMACMLPQVMDGQYHFIQNAMTGFPGVDSMVVFGWWRLAGLFAVVAVVKCLATASTLGSGASGGVLGPSVFIGGAVGASLGAVIEATFPGTFPPELRQTLIPVGMGGVLAASMRTPLAALVMVTEMTGSYGLIVPLMLVCMSAYVVGRRWGLNREQVPTAAESPAHAGDAVIHLLESWTVGQLMEPTWENTVSPDTTLSTLVERIKPGTRPIFAVAEKGRLLGVISVAEIRHIMEEEPGMADTVIAADIMTERQDTVHPDMDTYQALDTFKRGNHHVLPVVSRDQPHRWLGMLSRESVFHKVRTSLTESHRSMFLEHAGLAAIEQEGQLQQLVMGVTPMGRDMIQRLLVPMDAVGKSLREADFRKHYGAQVIAIEQPDGAIQCPPDLDKPLETNQRLLAIVWYESSTPPANE